MQTDAGVDHVVEVHEHFLGVLGVVHDAITVDVEHRLRRPCVRAVGVEGPVGQMAGQPGVEGRAQLGQRGGSPATTCAFALGSSAWAKWLQSGSITWVAIRAELPGVDPDEDIEVSIIDDRLTISARRERREESKEDEGFRSEFHHGSVRR